MSGDFKSGSGNDGGAYDAVMSMSTLRACSLRFKDSEKN